MTTAKTFQINNKKGVFVLENFKEKRNLDGVFFRVQRNKKWENVCFSDLSKDERAEIMSNRNSVWMYSMCNILADTLADIGEKLDIMNTF